MGARRRARQEVAELPDVVVPRPRSSRHVPSVHMLQLDPEPSAVADSANSSSRTSQVARFDGTTNIKDAEAVLTQAVQLTHSPSAPEETTIQPIDDATMLPHREEVSEEVPEEVQFEDDEEYIDDYEEEEEDEDEECVVDDEIEVTQAADVDMEGSGAVPPGLRLLHPLGAGRGAELTHMSAFGDSLAYTMEDTDASRMQSSALQASHIGPQSDVILDWRLAGGQEDGCGVTSEELAESLHLTAKFDSDGLLCDAQWHDPETEPADDVRPEAAATVLASVSPVAATPLIVPTISAEVRPVPTAAEREAAELAAAQKAAAKASERAAAKVVKLTSQIDKLYKDVVKDLDTPARLVWEELHALFQEKMTVDLTDEDQSDIERFLFEHLPVESTDMIWKVYKVLHLEQERDRCQRLLVS